MINQENNGRPKTFRRRADPGATAAIGAQLKNYYTSVEQEPIPDQLLDLLEKLDQAERSGKINGED